MTSPYVQRNLDNAQYAQPRGSQYEGPRSSFEEENDNVFEDARPTNVCYRHPGTTTEYGICPVCDIERDESNAEARFSEIEFLESELRAQHGDR